MRGVGVLAFRFAARGAVLGLALAGVGIGSPVLADKTVAADIKLPSALNLIAQADGCDNSGGPYITLTGEFLGSGVNGKLRAQNTSARHSNEVDAVLTARLVPDLGVPFSFPKQPPRGGVGGNPWIFFEAKDAKGNYLSDGPVLLGRCVQGLFNVSLLFELLSQASATIGGSCDNRGPEINIAGALVLGGVNGTILFSNKRTLDRHLRDVDGRLEFVILPEGGQVTFPKQPPLEGVTGNPLLFFQFTSPDGNGYSKEIGLGRCNKL